nr:reverse transcriptase domain-containing protein [Tanacetum cinerariifolium]
MPVWCRMFQQTLDGPAKGWFEQMPNRCIDGWADLREKFTKRFALGRKCSKDPTKISKIDRKANETLLNFKERWTEEMGYIQRVPKRVDDFVKSEEAYKSTELPKGEHPKRGQGTPYKGARPSRINQGGGVPKVDGYNTYNRKDHYQPYVPPRQPGRRYDNRRFDSRGQEINQLGLEALIKRPKEILAIELQLQLPSCPPMVGTPKKENLDRYCDYHGEKGHYTNDCYQLKRQLEAVLESGKLNHLVKDVRQRGNNRGRHAGNNSTNGKVINIVHVRAEDKKRICQWEGEEDWMNIPITFPPIQSGDVNEGALSHSICNACNDEVPDPKRNFHIGSSDSFHQKSSLLSLVILFSFSKNGRARSADLDRKQFSASNFPLKLCISFRVLGDFISATALVFFGLARIPSDILVDILNEIPVDTKHVEVCSLADEESLEEWTLFTDEASSLKGAQLVLIDLAGAEYTCAIRLNFTSTNNEAEYEALKIENMPRNQNQKADVLSKLASVAFNHLTMEVLVEVLSEKSVDVKEVSTIMEEEEDNWMTPIIRCLKEGIWPKDKNEARTLRMKISQYTLVEGVLFKRSYMSPMLRCIGSLQANYIIKEVHERAYEMHPEARSIVAKIMR